MYLLFKYLSEFCKNKHFKIVWKKHIKMLQMTEAAKLFSFKINRRNILYAKQRCMLLRDISTFFVKSCSRLELKLNRSSKYSINWIVHIWRRCPFASLIAKTGQVWTKTFTNTTKCNLRWENLETQNNPPQTKLSNWYTWFHYI